MRRRLRRAATGLAAAAVAGTALAVVPAGDAERPAAAGRADSRPTQTAVVERTTLLLQEEVDGALGYGEPTPVQADVAGKVTHVAPEGSTVRRGEALFAIDGSPTRLLYGATPLYRALQLGVSDGADVQVLEENLVALGYGDALGSDPDTSFTARTARALRRWQRDLDVPRTGALAVGAAAVADGPVRVAQDLLRRGEAAQPGVPVVEVTGTTPVVTVPLDARKVATVSVGDPASVELPDGGRATGKVRSVASVAIEEEAAAGGSGRKTVEVVVAFDEPSERGDLDGAPVSVHITRGRREGVLAVPVEALLVQPDGRYAVETVADDGRLRVVTVETGSYAQGKVEVDGAGLEPGVHVVVPS